MVLRRLEAGVGTSAGAARMSACATLLIGLAAPLLAQNASLTGRITDPSKALIAAARVAAISADTNLRYEAATNGSGEYFLANLPPGAYRIEIEKAGFKKLVKPDVILHVQDALEIDFEMTLGDAARRPSPWKAARLW